MPFTFIPFLLIITGVVITFVVLIKKFPQIALLDIDNLPQEIEKQKKKEILDDQFSRVLKKFSSRVQGISLPLSKFLKKIQTLFRARVQKTYFQYAKTRAQKKGKEIKKIPPPEALAALLNDAERLLLLEKFDDAERSFIEVLRFAPRTVDAYRGLGRLYFATGKYDEAKETYAFLVKLDPKDGRAFNRLGMIAYKEERFKDAIEYLKRALEIDPHIAVRHYDLGQAYEKMDKTLYALRAYERAVGVESMNPKYLDAYLRVAILLKNKDVAREVYEQFRIANPENQKLDELRRTIDDL